MVAAHGLRNALLPVVTQLGLLLGELLAGAAVVEVVFAWPGLGKLAVDAIATKDYPVIQGVVLFSAVIYLAVGLILDLLYARLDPRVAVGRPSPAATPPPSWASDDRGPLAPAGGDRGAGPGGGVAGGVAGGATGGGPVAHRRGVD